jgi:hypothetical protein
MNKLSTQEKLNRLIYSLLRGEEIAGIKKTIIRQLNRFGFSCRSIENSSIDFTYVINEAYIRTSKSISDNPDRINDLPSWIKQVSLNIIREERRRQQKTTSVYSSQNNLGEEAVSLIDDIPDPSNVINELTLELDLFFERESLSVESKQIMLDRSNSYSWREIAASLMEKDPVKYQNKNIDTVAAQLRKKYSRLCSGVRQSKVDSV